MVHSKTSNRILQIFFSQISTGDILTFGVYFTFTIVLFAALFFAVLVEHQLGLIVITVGLLLNMLLIFFIPIHILAVTFYIILILDLGCFIYVLQRGGVAAVLNQP